MNLTSQTPGLSYSRVDSTPIGAIEVFASQAGISRINLQGHSFQKSKQQNPINESELTRKALQQILEYLSGQRRLFDLPLDLSAVSPFQKKALLKSMEIPFGKVMTYGELAKCLENTAASRAVGGAMARNPLPLVIPCHRVVAADGRLTGYSAAEGIRTKQWLLELEGHQIVSEKLA